jgi:NADPH:quinone reductase-like Zn-dependent oxidoreductase
MKRVVVKRPGGIQRLVIEEAAHLLPTSGEVCVEVRGIGINFADLVVRLGLYRSAKEFVGWPITPGFEVSGTVTSVGDEVRGFRTGDRVIGLTRFGAYATRICLPEAQVVRVPDGVDLLAMGGFPVAFLTAWYALHELSKLRPGYRVLVHSAAGGVGGALVMLAKRAGCRVVGVVSSERKVSAARDAGADLVVDASAEDVWRAVERESAEGFHVVLDANGGHTLLQSYRHVRPGGRLVVYGFHTLLRRGRDRLGLVRALIGLLRTPRFNPMKMIDDNRSVHAFNLSYLFNETALFQEAIADLFGALESGEIRPLPYQALPFDQVQEAHRLLHSGATTGKVVLEV